MGYCELHAGAAWIGNRLGGISDPALLTRKALEGLGALGGSREAAE